MTPPPFAPSLRSVVPSLVVDGLFPFLAYKLLMAYVPVSQVQALGISAVFPAGKGVLGIWHRRQLDFIGIVVLIGIAVSIIAALVGGGPRAFLIRESFVTGALGLVALSSFAWPRPLLFYIGRQFSTGQEPIAVERFNDLWQHPGARRTFRILTAVWATGWLGEFALRVLMVLTLSVGQVLVISPFVFNAITLGLFAWTVAYVRHRQRRAATAPRSGEQPDRTIPQSAQKPLEPTR